MRSARFALNPQSISTASLGPGLLESVSEIVLAHDLGQRGLHVERQVPITIEYKGIRFEDAFRADLLVERKVIIELKSVEQMNLTHRTTCV